LITCIFASWGIVEMVKRVTVRLEQQEYSALLDIAIEELRNPPDQLRHILRLELERRGLLSPTDQHTEAQPQDQEAEAQ
jgi:hypothetical protein